MDALLTLGRSLGLSFTAGINLYATVIVLGLASRYAWIDLPPGFEAFDNDWVLGVAVVLYLIEFLADKVPWVDTAWDTVHTLIRPLGGAIVAVAALGESAPTMQIVAALLGGSVAATTHAAKAGARVTVNASPEPVSNSIVSLAEDAFVFFLAGLAIVLPLAAAGLAIVLLAAILYAGARLVRRRRARPRATA